MGVGLSHPIQCPTASATCYASTADPNVPADRPAAALAAQTYATDCVAEAKADPADLPFSATRQAVEDLEAIRQYLGAEKLYLYGERYGTQYVQTYGAPARGGRAGPQALGSSSPNEPGCPRSAASFSGVVSSPAAKVPGC